MYFCRLVFYMKKIILSTILFFVFGFSLYSQSIGIRAGLNYSKFSGPVVSSSNEAYNFSSGFHFGINLNQFMTDKSYLRFELLYIQNGSNYKINGDSYYYIRSDEPFYERGNTDINLDISNAYISLPITYHYSISKKIELHAGGYFNILIGPKGSGTLKFDSRDNPDKIKMQQSLDYNYNSDRAGYGYIPNSQLFPTIIVGDENVPLFSYLGAYYQYQEKLTNRFRWFDAGLSFGGSYFFNRGFYGSVRLDYGLVDLTKTEGDISITEVDLTENKALNKTTRDTHVGIQASLGFKF